jgi:RNA-directed DNA polymerase
MTTPLPAAALFKARFNKTNLLKIFDSFFSDGASVGRDGTKLDMFKARLDEEIEIILRKVKACTFEFTSYKEKLISKGAGKFPRQLSIPTIRDKLVLKFLAQFLAELYPGQVAWVPHSTIKRVHEVSRTRPDTDFYLRLDIENFYPSINHKILMRILRRKVRNKQILHLIENAIKTPTGKQKSTDTTNVLGVPQGLSISNILASIYLTDIDKKFVGDPTIDYFRFVDDILIVASQPRTDELEKTVPSTIKQKRRLKCHEVGKGTKSIKVSLKEGIDYLGYRFCIDNIEVRSSSQKKMFANLMKIMTGMKYKKNRGRLIWRLNLRVSGCQLKGRRIGWLFFFSQSKNIQQLKQLDAFVAKHASKILPVAELEKLKRFVKAYYELKFHTATTKYFPNFDAFDNDQKKAQIAVLLPEKSNAQLDALSQTELDDLFQKCVNHEIADLEMDMMEVFS